LIKTIRSEFEIKKDAEIAIEVDPRNVNEEKVATYAKAGINRVSIGVQDFNLEVQKAINREQSFDVVYDCVKLFRKFHINNINLDLIYGLPKQTLEMVKKNIDFSMLLKPSRIALFAYAHVQWKKKHMRLIDENDLPGGENKLAMYQAAAKKLNEEGYFSIGLDHFAKSDDSMFEAFHEEKLKRNFQGYSTDNANCIIGFGASAISYLPSGYAQNTLDFEEYKKNILSEKLPVIKGVEINKEDKIRKKIIDELMCYMEVDLKKICEEFSLPKNSFNQEIELLENLKSDGLVRIKNNKIKINLAAPQISRVVSSVFDKFFQPEAQRHSKIA
jgi:oxygen-independent coproporphyrinogen-3 oxidase